MEIDERTLIETTKYVEQLILDHKRMIHEIEYLRLELLNIIKPNASKYVKDCVLAMPLYEGKDGKSFIKRIKECGEYPQFPSMDTKMNTK